VLKVVGCDFNMEPHARRIAVAEYSHSSADAQEAAMFRNFAATVLSRNPNPFWGEVTLKTQRVLDACLQSARSGGQMLTLNPSAPPT
jgi:predicted dehydrogenase